MTELCQQLGMPMSIATHGRGTATRSMMDLLGIENNFKRIVLNVASPEKTRELIRELKRKLFLGDAGAGHHHCGTREKCGRRKDLGLSQRRTIAQIYPGAEF